MSEYPSPFVSWCRQALPRPLVLSTLPSCGRLLKAKRAAGIAIRTNNKRIGNGRQMFHSDFNQTVLDYHHGAGIERDGCAPRTWPWTVLAFLSAPGWLFVVLHNGQVVKLWVPQGGAVLFRGDVLHAGAAYEEWHLRAHWYFMPRESAFRSAQEDPEVWRLNADGNLALHCVDPWKEWAGVEDHTRDPVSACLFSPRLLTIDALTAPAMHPYLHY